MTNSNCISEDCEERAAVRGWCKRHYATQYNRGLIELDPTRHRLADVDRDSRTGICSICGPVKVRVRTGGRGSECMTQRRAHAAKRRRIRGARTRTPRPISGMSIQEDRRYTRYRITPARTAEMLEEQGGECPICAADISEGFHVDHDHACCPGPNSCGDCVRGLLCARCNYALGWLNDSTQSMRSAIDYLER